LITENVFVCFEKILKMVVSSQVAENYRGKILFIDEN